jgi:RNA polymerase sigma-70 factor (ECF subfamily)
MEDAAIVDLYWQRDQQAIPETDRKYGRYCHAIAYNICTNHEDAEECVNDTWFRAWNLMPDKRPTILSTFLGMISRNYALDRYRSRTRQKRGGGETELTLEELTDCVPSRGGVEQQLEEQELEQAIDAFLSTLSASERKIFVARYWFVAPVKEIAGKLDCSPGKVKTTLYRLRGRLRAYLQEEGFL